MLNKKRILCVSDASFFSTGYSTYTLEVMKRFHASGKYDLMEMGCYAQDGDERAADLPWAWRSGAAKPHEQGSIHGGDFGAARFEETCIEFKPDIVISWRDAWMDSFIQESPFRHFFHFAHMPTVDAEPQNAQWLALYADADAIFTYSDWGLGVLNKQSRGTIKTISSASPGADLETYKVYPDKRAHRDRLGIDPNAFIVGTVMRNQKRKLYPDLIESFAVFLKQAPKELAEKTFLHLHTSWPDLGWDIPLLITEAGIGHKTLFTYFCKNCGKFYPSFFQDAIAVCRACGQYSATFPNSSIGVNRGALNEIYNLWDCYIQLAMCEGFGMPMVEAAACGVPVFAVDYSAMADVVRKVGGYPIKVQRYFRESETHRRFALPDNADFVAQLIAFLQLPEPIRRKKGWEARKGVEQHYTWDQAAAAWMGHFDSVEVRSHEATWLSKAKPHVQNFNFPEGLSNEDFVNWGLTHVAGRPDLAGSYVAVRLTRDLNWGACVSQCTGGSYLSEWSVTGERPHIQPFNRETAVSLWTEMCERHNFWEARRMP